MNDPIIKIQNITFHYETPEGESEKQLLSDYSLEIQRGSFVAILGHNASGKSTVAKLMNGLQKPISGKVFVNGIDTADESQETLVRRTVGMVFQNPDNQLVATIVEEDVAFGPENLGVPQPEILRRVKNALEAVGMLDYRAHAPHKLSGGQKQRIAIAGIIAMEPECIVLDEPTAMLDPRGRAEVISTILRLNQELGITIILITHYMDEAALSDRVVVMNKGKITLDGLPRDVFGEVEELRAAGLDIPQPAEFMFKMKQDGLPYREKILTTEECAEAIIQILEESGIHSENIGEYGISCNLEL